VRKAGTQVRITGQLIDATTGAHLWADRFEGSLEDVFELQDKVDVERSLSANRWRNQGNSWWIASVTRTAPSIYRFVIETYLWFISRQWVHAIRIGTLPGLTVIMTTGTPANPLWSRLVALGANCRKLVPER
jgi:hypothetical protein